MSVRSDPTPLALLCAVGGLLVATAGVDPQSRFPVLLIGGALLGVTAVSLTWFAWDRAGKFLVGLILYAVAVRLVLFGIVRATVGPYVFAPDQLTYEIVGMEVLSSWTQGLAMPRHARGGLQAGYYLFNGFVFRIFGDARAAPAMFNVFLGAWTPVVVYATVVRVVRGNHGVARLAALFVAFFPSLVLWSVLNVREAPTILAIALIVYAATRIQEHPDLWGLVTLLIGSVVLAASREYLMVLVCGASAAGLLFARGRSPALSVMSGVGILFLLTVVLQTSGVGGTLVTEPSLERIQALRADLAIGAASAYGQDYDVSTISGAFTFLPVGFAHFLFAPFPWRIASVLQTVTLPETLLWYCLFPFVVRGVYLGLRHDPRSLSVLVSVLFVVVLGYSLVEGNVGTAFRHRAQILPLLFIFGAVGARDTYGMLRERSGRAGSVGPPAAVRSPR